MTVIRGNGRYVAAVFLLLLIFGLPSLFYPFGRDQGIHAQVGAAWLDGQLPYRDVWHPKGFLSFVPHALVTAVFGHKMWGIRVFDFVWQFGSGLLIFLIGVRRMGKRGGLLAAGLFYLVYFGLGYWHLAQPEGFLTPVVLLAVWLYDRAADSNRPGLLVFLSGFFVALAPWFKQTAVVFVVAFVAWAIFDFWSTRENKVGPIVGGIFLANSLVLALMAVTGMLAPMLEAFSYAFFDYPALADDGFFEIARLSVAWGIWYPALIFPFLAGLGFLIFNREFWPDWIGVVLMALAGLASIYIQRHLWLYHWVSTLPFMVLIGAFSIESSLAFLRSITDKRRQSFVWLFVLACFSLALPPLSRHLPYYVRLGSYLSGQTSKEAYLADFFEIQEVIEVVDYLTARTAEDEPIFVWGHFSVIYYLADRPNPTRFINDPPLSLPHSRQAAWRQEAAAALAANPPTYIIVANNDDTSFEPQTSKEQLPDFTALATFLASNYQLKTTIGNFEVYLFNE